MSRRRQCRKGTKGTSAFRSWTSRLIRNYTFQRAMIITLTRITNGHGSGPVAARHRTRFSVDFLAARAAQPPLPPCDPDTASGTDQEREREGGEGGKERETRGGVSLRLVKITANNPFLAGTSLFLNGPGTRLNSLSRWFTDAFRCKRNYEHASAPSRHGQKKRKRYAVHRDLWLIRGYRCAGTRVSLIGCNWLTDVRENIVQLSNRFVIFRVCFMSGWPESSVVFVLWIGRN